MEVTRIYIDSKEQTEKQRVNGEHQQRPMHGKITNINYKMEKEEK